MLSNNNPHETYIYQKKGINSHSKGKLEEVRNGGKLMCLISPYDGIIEIVKEKNRKTVITFMLDCTVIENHNNSTSHAFN